jgi:hypothetical protein
MLLPVWGALAIVAATPAAAATLDPDHIAYDSNVSEDPAVRACTLGLALSRTDVGETVDVRLIVARSKRADALAGPVVFGVSIEVRDAPVAKNRASEARAVEISSAAFSSERYAAAAHRGTAPFADRSWVVSTLDSAAGGEIVDAAVGGRFQIAYTRTRPSAARVFAVTSAPPRDVTGRFSDCVDALQAIE